MRQYFIDMHYRGAPARYLQAIKDGIEIVEQAFFKFDGHIQDILHVSDIVPNREVIKAWCMADPDNPDTWFVIMLIGFIDEAFYRELVNEHTTDPLQAIRLMNYNQLNIITTLMLNDTRGMT